jgi:hypothetical protein
MKKNLPVITAALLAAGLVYSLFPAGRPSPVERFGRLAGKREYTRPAATARR